MDLPTLLRLLKEITDGKQYTEFGTAEEVERFAVFDALRDLLVWQPKGNRDPKPETLRVLGSIIMEFGNSDDDPDACLREMLEASVASAGKIAEDWQLLLFDEKKRSFTERIFAVENVRPENPSNDIKKRTRQFARLVLKAYKTHTNNGSVDAPDSQDLAADLSELECAPRSKPEKSPHNDALTSKFMLEVYELEGILGHSSEPLLQVLAFRKLADAYRQKHMYEKASTHDTPPYVGDYASDVLDGFLNARRFSGLSIVPICQHHRIESFDCGESTVNELLRELRDESFGRYRGRARRTFVAEDDEDVLGFVCIEDAVLELPDGTRQDGVEYIALGVDRAWNETSIAFDLFNAVWRQDRHNPSLFTVRPIDSPSLTFPFEIPDFEGPDFKLPEKVEVIANSFLPQSNEIYVELLQLGFIVASAQSPQAEFLYRPVEYSGQLTKGYANSPFAWRSNPKRVSIDSRWPATFSDLPSHVGEPGPALSALKMLAYGREKGGLLDGLELDLSERELIEQRLFDTLQRLLAAFPERGVLPKDDSGPLDVLLSLFGPPNATRKQRAAIMLQTCVDLSGAKRFRWKNMLLSTDAFDIRLKRFTKEENAMQVVMHEFASLLFPICTEELANMNPSRSGYMVFE